MTETLTVRYVGPIDAVEIDGVPDVVEQGESIQVDVDLGRRLLSQRDAFEPCDAPGRAYVEQYDSLQDAVADADPVHLDLDRLTIAQLRTYADERDIDLTGKDRKPDIINTILGSVQDNEGE